MLFLLQRKSPSILSHIQYRPASVVITVVRKYCQIGFGPSDSCIIVSMRIAAHLRITCTRNRYAKQRSEVLFSRASQHCP